jgi:HEAT repeat protein
LEDRPLRRGAEDLLGFEPIAAGLAAQLQATTSGGWLAAVSGRRRGCGRSSFLNLLASALSERGASVLRFSGGDDLTGLLRQARVPAGAPSAIALIDDAEPEAVSCVEPTAGGPTLVVAWSAAVEAPAAACCPLLIELPSWGPRLVTAWLDARIGEVDDGERAAWTTLLSSARTPRDAVRLSNAAASACACSPAPPRAILSALALALGVAGPDAQRDAETQALVEHAARFCGAVELERPAAAITAAASEAIFGSTPEPSPQASPEAGLDADSLPGVESKRRRCVELAGRGGRASTEELLRLLADEHPSVRLSASHALAALADPAAAPELRRLLGSSDASLRRTAAFVLGRLGDEGSREELVRLLVDVTPSARRAAAAALGKLGGEAVVRPLLLALNDQHAGVRMAAETALSRTLSDLPETFIDGLARSGDERVRSAAIAAAGRLGFGTRGAIESLLFEPGAVAVHAAEALGRRREAASLPALARAVAGERGDLRTASLEAVGRISEGSAANGLASLLSHEDEEAREAGKLALARCPGAYEAVLPFLGQADLTLRSSAADALGRCGDQRAIGPLLEAHDRGDAELRRAAAASLVRLGFEP